MKSLKYQKYFDLKMMNLVVAKVNWAAKPYLIPLSICCFSDMSISQDQFCWSFLHFFPHKIRKRNLSLIRMTFTLSWVQITAKGMDFKIDWNDERAAYVQYFRKPQLLNQLCSFCTKWFAELPPHHFYFYIFKI